VWPIPQAEELEVEALSLFLEADGLPRRNVHE
jgi:hypothetical protein